MEYPTVAYAIYSFIPNLFCYTIYMRSKSYSGIKQPIFVLRMLVFFNK